MLPDAQNYPGKEVGQVNCCFSTDKETEIQKSSDLSSHRLENDISGTRAHRYGLNSG